MGTRYADAGKRSLVRDERFYIRRKNAGERRWVWHETAGRTIKLSINSWSQ